jgi:mannose-6-phosphate isomerase-like protein (cupin superfamily)
MHIRGIQDVKQALISPLGEHVYELIGSSELTGQAAGHSLAYILLPPGGISNRHFHKESEESYYILSGEGDMQIDGNSVHLLPGQACLIKPPSTHQIGNHAKQDLIFIAVCTPPWAPADSYPADEA